MTGAGAAVAEGVCGRPLASSVHFSRLSGREVANEYLQPPATGEAEALSEKHLVNFTTGAAVASLLGKAPHLPAALFRSGESDDASTILRASDGALIAGASLRGCIKCGRNLSAQRPARY